MRVCLCVFVLFTLNGDEESEDKTEPRGPNSHHLNIVETLSR